MDSQWGLFFVGLAGVLIAIANSIAAVINSASTKKQVAALIELAKTTNTSQVIQARAAVQATEVAKADLALQKQKPVEFS